MEAGKSSHGPDWSRHWRRLWKPFLTKDEKSRIRAAVEEAERRTTVRIVVTVIARVGSGDILKLAQRHYEDFAKHKSVNENGVLLLVSHLDHRFALWGTAGVHSKTGDAFWQRAAKTLTHHFADRRYAEGIEICVRRLGDELARHFIPRDSTGEQGQDRYRGQAA